MEENEREELDIAPRRKSDRLLLIVLLLFALIAVVALLFVVGAQGTRARTAASPSPTQETPKVDESFTGIEVYFLDVGQGDCAILRGPHGKTMLVDAGPGGSFPKIRALLTSLGITKLDMVVCSHMHSDHIGAMAEVVRHYEIGSFYLTPFDTENVAYADLVDALYEENVPAVPVYASASILLPWDEDVEVRVLSPFEVKYDDYNDTSLMLHVQYGATAVLLCGDATELSERIALKAFPNHYMRANVLKVGHHGSESSSCKRFLQAVKPEFALISVGADNDYGLPDEIVLKRLTDAGARIFRTDTDGTILFALDGTRAWVVE